MSVLMDILHASMVVKHRLFSEAQRRILAEQRLRIRPSYACIEVLAVTRQLYAALTKLSYLHIFADILAPPVTGCYDAETA